MEFTLTVLGNQEVTPGVHAITLETPRALRSQFEHPGQYVQLDVGSGRPAYMAIASAPSAPGFEFLIQRSEGTAGLICDLRPGQELQCSKVMGGGFPMERAEGTRVLFFAGGTGISAVRSLIESRSWSGARLYYGANSESELCYRDRFAAWEARGVVVVPCVDRFPNQAWADEGHQDASGCSAVLCGPGPMLQAVTELLVGRGMSPDRCLKNY